MTGNGESADPLSDVFHIHEPPSGGLADLQNRLQSDRRLRWWMLAVPAAIAIAVLLYLAPWSNTPPLYVVVAADQEAAQPSPPTSPISSHPGLVGMGLAEGTTEPVTTPVAADGQVTAQVMNTGQVAFYWIGSLSAVDSRR